MRAVATFFAILAALSCVVMVLESRSVEALVYFAGTIFFVWVALRVRLSVIQRS